MLVLTQLSNYLTLKGSFSAVSKPNSASKYALESSRRDLQNALLCTVSFSRLNVLFENRKSFAKFLPTFANSFKYSLEFVDFCADVYRNFTKSCRINKNYQIFAEILKICEI